MPRFQVFKSQSTEYRYIVVDTEDQNRMIARADNIQDATLIVEDINRAIFQDQIIEEAMENPQVQEAP